MISSQFHPKRARLSYRQRLGIVSLSILLIGAALFGGIARFGHVDFNNYHQRDCFVSDVLAQSNGETLLHYYFWSGGVERVYQDQTISSADGSRYHQGDEFQCVFYNDQGNFITSTQFYIQIWLIVGSVALVIVGFVLVISTALGAERRFE